MKQELRTGEKNWLAFFLWNIIWGKKKESFVLHGAWKIKPEKNSIKFIPRW